MNNKLTEAICYAAKAHEGQTRKNGKTPYILHAMEVSSIIGGMTDNEDVMIAGLLHDTVEDAGKTPEEIERLFGRRVRELVAGETENKRRELPAEQTWKIRKEESLRELRNSDDLGLKQMWLADKLSNIRSIYRYWLADGDAAFNIFHQKDKKEHEWYYRTVAEYLACLSETAAYSEYVRLVDAVFGNNK